MCSFPSPLPRSLAVALSCASLALMPSAFAETWTDLRGTNSVDAKMIGLWDDNVILQLNNGRRVKVSMSKLRGDSRIQARQLDEKLRLSRGERVKELQGQASEAAAPAPNPLPQPPAAPAYSPPKANARPDEFLRQVDSAVRNGHLIAIYDALPPSYRRDVDELVRLAAAKTSSDDWQRVVGTLHSLGDLIVTRQRWFLSSPRITSLPADSSETLERQVLALAGLLREGLSPQQTQLEQLRSVEFGKWLAQRDEEIAPHLAQLLSEIDTGMDREITLASPPSNDVAVITVGSGTQKPRINYTLVEGYWVPKTLADGWEASVAQWKQKLSETPDGTFLADYANVVAQLAPMITPMAAASDEGRFHEAMESVVTQTEQTVTAMAALFGQRIDLAGRSNARGGYDQYGMGYEDQSGSESEIDSSYGQGMSNYNEGMQRQMQREQMAREQSMRQNGQRSGGPSGP